MSRRVKKKLLKTISSFSLSGAIVLKLMIEITWLAGCAEVTPKSVG